MKCISACLLSFVLSSLSQAQSLSQSLQQRIDQQLREYYLVPPSVVISIGAPRASEFAAFDILPVTFQDDKKRETPEFLLSKDRRTLLRLQRFDLTEDMYERNRRNIEVHGLVARGSAHAKVTIVVFDDYECPFCARQNQVLVQEVLGAYGSSIRVFYKDFPLSIHAWAKHASVDAHCLAAQNSEAFWAFTDYIHLHQREFSVLGSQAQQLAAVDSLAMAEGVKSSLDNSRLASCIKGQELRNEVDASIDEGTQLGVNATPTLFVNGRRIEGFKTSTELKEIIDEALR